MLIESKKTRVISIKLQIAEVAAYLGKGSLYSAILSSKDDPRNLFVTPRGTRLKIASVWKGCACISHLFLHNPFF